MRGTWRKVAKIQMLKKQQKLWRWQNRRHSVSANSTIRRAKRMWYKLITSLKKIIRIMKMASLLLWSCGTALSITSPSTSYPSSAVTRWRPLRSRVNMSRPLPVLNNPTKMRTRTSFLGNRTSVPSRGPKETRHVSWNPTPNRKLLLRNNPTRELEKWPRS